MPRREGWSKGLGMWVVGITMGLECLAMAASYFGRRIFHVSEYELPELLQIMPLACVFLLLSMLPLLCAAMMWDASSAEKSTAERTGARIFGILIGCAAPVFVWLFMDDVSRWYREAAFCRKTFAALRNDSMKRDEAPRIIKSSIETKTIYASTLVSNLIRASIPGTETILIGLMRDLGDRDIAAALLNSGNNQLRDAATDWAREKGYSIKTVRTGQGSAQWR